MDDATFDQKMLSLIAEAVPARFRKAAFTSEARLQRDLGLDSIALLALLFRFEQTFGIDLATVDIGGSLARMRTVGDALTVGRAALQQANAAGAAER